MVTHSTTDLPIWYLSMAERTGCPVFTSLWSYVLEDVTFVFMNSKLVARTPPKSTRKSAKWIVKAALMSMNAKLVARTPPKATRTTTNWIVQVWQGEPG